MDGDVSCVERLPEIRDTGEPETRVGPENPFERLVDHDASDSS